MSNIVNFKSTATTKMSHIQWFMPLILTLRRQKQVNPYEFTATGVYHSMFQDGQDYTM